MFFLIQGKEKGILKLDPRPRVLVESKSELTPQVRYIYTIGIFVTEDIINSIIDIANLSY